MVERLERQGMVTRRKSSSDGRGQVATLTDVGLDRLRSAWPTHLDGARRIVLENLRELDLPTLTRALNAISAYEPDLGSTRRRSADSRPESTSDRNASTKDTPE